MPVLLGLLIVFLAVLVKFLAGLDRVQSLWHQRTPALPRGQPHLYGGARGAGREKEKQAPSPG